MSEAKQQEVEIKVNLPAELQSGVYANYLNITSSPWDYILTFCQVMPETGSVDGQTVQAAAKARVVIPATLIDSVINALAVARDKQLKMLKALIQQGEEESK